MKLKNGGLSDGLDGLGFSLREGQTINHKFARSRADDLALLGERLRAATGIDVTFRVQAKPDRPVVYGEDEKCISLPSFAAILWAAFTDDELREAYALAVRNGELHRRRQPLTGRDYKMKDMTEEERALVRAVKNKLRAA